VTCEADVIVAQGSEAGGFGGFVSGLALVQRRTEGGRMIQR